MILNYNAILGSFGLEAKDLRKTKVVGQLSSDYFVSEKVGDLITVFPLGMKEEDVLTLFDDISKKKSKLRTVKFNGYHIKPVINEKISSKRILVNLRKEYSKITKSKKENGIATVSNRINAFASMGYMHNLGYLTDAIKSAIFDNKMAMSTAIRGSIVDVIKRTVINSAPQERSKVIYFKGPFLLNTGINLTIIDSKLLRLWSPILLFLEWLEKDEAGFKAWMNDNNVTLVFDNGGRHLALSSDEKYQKLPHYNIKYILRLLHKMDGTSLGEDDITDAELDENELGRVSASPTDSEVLDAESKLDDTIVEVDDGMADDLELVKDNEDGTVPESTKLATAIEMDKIFNDASLDDSDKAVELLEIHNFTKFKKDMETDTIKNMRKTMLKKYGKDLKATLDQMKRHKIDVETYSNTVENGYNSSTFANLDKSYQEKIGDYDFMQALTAPANMTVPSFFDGIDIKNISDREFRGDLLTIKYLSHQGKEMEVEIEKPSVVNGSIFLGGSSKYLTNQDLAIPIKKEDESVIITMSYNKTILNIKGKFGSAEDKVFVKSLNNFSKVRDSLKVKTTETLSEFIYDNRMSYRMIHLNKHFGGIRHVANGLDIDFDFRGKFKNVETGFTNCGTINGKTIMHNASTDEFWYDNEKERKSSSEFISDIMSTIDKDEWENSKVKKLDNLNFVNGAYCKIMAKELPCVLVMLIETPLKDLLDRLVEETGLKYTVVDNEKLNVSKLKNDSKFGYIILADYTIRIEYVNIVNQIILVPLINMDMTNYSAFDITTVIKDIAGSGNTSMYLENFATSFISGGDKRVLEMCNMPTDFTGVFIYAVSLFYDYQTYYSSDARGFRLVTPSEVINRVIYELLMKEMSNNVGRVKSGSRASIRIPREAIAKSLQTTMTNVSEDSNVSPFRSIMLASSKSQKGHLGVNVDRAYSKQRRMFNANNLGTETFATAYSGQAGIVKYLPFNPTFKDLTGRYNSTDSPDNLDPSNLYTFTDSYVPYLTRDDTPRRLMTNGQFSHIIAGKDMDPMLVSTGADESALYMVPEFSYIGEGPGEVKSINDMFVTIKYDDKKLGTKSYRLKNSERNSAKGYFLKNDFAVDSKLKVGKRIKEGTTLAYNELFFKKKANGKVSLCAGVLTPVVIIDGEGTWEDSTVVFQTLSEKLATPLVKRITAKLDLEKTEILDMFLGLDENVDPETELIKYNRITEDTGINDFFSDVEGINTKAKTAHYRGKLVDIQVYYRTKGNTKTHKSILDLIRNVTVLQNNKHHMKDLHSNTDQFNKAIKSSAPTELTRGQFSKINGDIIHDGQILIEFMIEVWDKVGPSDKLVVDRPLKAETTEVLADTERPVGVLTGRKANMMIDTQSVNARKTPGISLHGSILGILLHTAIKNRILLNLPPEKDSLLDYKSSMDMVEGKLWYK